MPNSSPRLTAVLLMAYGSATSRSRSDVKAYLTHILQFYRGTDPTDEEVEDLRRRYEAVGGSPLYDITERILAGTQRALDLAFPGAYRVCMAMKHSLPYIEDATREIAADGDIDQGIGIALAPFRSRLSTEGYYRLVTETNRTLEGCVDWRFVNDWHLHPLFLELWQRRIEDALSTSDDDPVVVFTNHSLPARVREWDDPYEEQFRATAEALAERCGLARWTVAFQSAGGGGVPWLGPELAAVLEERTGKGARSFLAVPIGFLMDHLEVLYDLDIAAQARAHALGVRLERTRMPNDDPLLVAMLTDVVRRVGARQRAGTPAG